MAKIRIFPRSKKHQSEIIVVVLLIVIVIAVVVVLWNVVYTVINTNSKKVDVGTFTTKLEIKQAKTYITGDSDITIFRNSGEGDVTGLKFILTDSNGKTYIVERNTSIKELETKFFLINAREVNNSKIEKISLVPEFGDNSGMQISELGSEIKKDSSGSRLLEIPDTNTSNGMQTFANWGLVSWWKFDKDFNDFLGKNNCTPVNNPKIINSSLFLDGTSHLNCGNNPRLNPKNITILVKAKRTGINNGGVGPMEIVSNSRNGDITLNGYDFGINSDYTYLRVAINNKGISIINTPSTNPFVSLNTLYYFAFTYDSAFINLYSNGLSVNSPAPFTGGIGSPASYNLYIGSMGMYPATYDFNGTISNMMIFNRSLSANEIKKIYDFFK